MNIPGIPDLKTPLLWLLGIALAASMVANGWQRIQVANATAALATEKAGRATENSQRADVALADVKEVVAAQADHGTTQQGITDEFELSRTKQALAAADADKRALADRLRDTSAALTAASDRAQADGDPAACVDQGNRYRAVFGLLGEAGQLLERSGGLARESGSLLGQRENEVAALKAIMLNDRTLMDRAAGVRLGLDPKD